MFFTKVGQVIAWLAFVFGLLRAGMGIVLALNGIPSARYLGSASTGEAIDQGVIIMAIGVALGVLYEISKARSA